MNKGALEALIPILKLLVLYKEQQNDKRRAQAKNGSLPGRRMCFRCRKEEKV